jgi:hypothetical protein
MSGAVIFLLIAVVLGALIWMIRATGSERNVAPRSGLFDVDGRRRSEPGPVRTPTTAPHQVRRRARGGQTAVRGRVKNLDAPCWVCSKSLADGHTH